MFLLRHNSSRIGVLTGLTLPTLLLALIQQLERVGLQWNQKSDFFKVCSVCLLVWAQGDEWFLAVGIVIFIPWKKMGDDDDGTSLLGPDDGGRNDGQLIECACLFLFFFSFLSVCVCLLPQGEVVFGVGHRRHRHAEKNVWWRRR